MKRGVERFRETADSQCTLEPPVYQAPHPSALDVGALGDFRAREEDGWVRAEVLFDHTVYTQSALELSGS